MKINRDVPNVQTGVNSPTTAPNTGKVFGDALISKSQPAESQPLSGVAQGLNKADLADPAKADAAIHQAVGEMMDREFNGMSAPDREHVAAWLRKDPVVRDALLKRLASLAPA